MYREQMHACPPGYEYKPSHADLFDSDAPKQEIQAARRRGHRLRSRAKAAGVHALGRSGAVLRRRVDDRGVDLVHSAQMLPRTRRPYVVDFEEIHVFSLYQPGALERPWARRRLTRVLMEDRCRAVLPWTEAAGHGLLAALGPDAPSGLAGKVRVVTPAIRPRRSAPRRRRPGPLRVLFVGSSFFVKGGVEAVAALSAVRATHEAELDLVTIAPPRWRSRLAAVPGLRLHEQISNATVRELYANADVLLFPAHMDTLGWVVFEAHADALPVVAADLYSLPETVADGESGMLFPNENSIYGPDGLPRHKWINPASPPASLLRALAAPSSAYVDGIASRLAALAEDPALLERLSAGALERVTTGALSMGRRRDALAQVYSAAAA
jgi:glycosyltransferase involved in cell wall biosynthesis